MGVFASSFDFSQIKEFYCDTDTDFVHSNSSFPREVKEVADKLNGQKMKIGEALNKIIAVTDNNQGWEVMTDSKESCIKLKVHIGGRFDTEYTFCIIKFR